MFQRLLLCALLTVALGAAQNLPFPAGDIPPFTSIYYVTPPAANGDSVVEGQMSMSTWMAIMQLPLPSSPGQLFSDAPLELAPDRFFTQVYLPTAAERYGDFSAFPGQLRDSLGNPLPANIIPASMLPSLYAFRIKGTEVPWVAIGRSSQTFPAVGGTGTVGITACSTCAWTASSPLDWVTLTGLTSGTGSGSVSYSVTQNTGGPRSGTFTVAGFPFEVQQISAATALRFVPAAPCRVADTRMPSGPFGGPTMKAGSTRSFAIPQSACGIPPTAQAYSLNVTVVPNGRLSFLTLWPAGQSQALVSTLNSWDGIVVANAAIVPAGSNGAVSVFATDPTDVILDIDGYFDSSAGPSAFMFYPATPCRVADTRGPIGQFGGPSLSGGQARDFSIPSSSCGIPPTATAYSLNVTALPQTNYLGFLTAGPSGPFLPAVSTLNSWTGKVVANAAIVPAGANQAVSVFVSDPVDLVLDINGCFGQPGGAGALSFYPVTPCRVADTRGAAGPFGGPEMEADSTRSFAIPASGCWVPSTAAAYSVNVTVVPDARLSYLSAWPAGSGAPAVSTLNSWDGSVVANAAIVPAGAGGAISIYVTDPTHVILDINGYFAP